MGIQFGLWHPSGPAIEEPELLELAQRSAHYACDGTYIACRHNLGVGYQPFITHERSKQDLRPTVFADGCIVALDGRIDNYAELRGELSISDSAVADPILIAALFRHCGSSCFSKLIGDWAIAIWSPREQSLYLARDHAGARTLYFKRSRECVLWSTVLDTFVCKDSPAVLDAAYATRYLSCLPIRDLTPYRGILAVPPAHYLVISQGGVSRQRHWEPTTKDEIRYRSDDEYENHFLSLLRQSVSRRTVSGGPIIAELSGGVDSSSIVCISDQIVAERGASPSDLLDTISYFDDSEPNWDERRYFSVVEVQRGKSGIHLNIASINRCFEPFKPGKFHSSLPGIDRYAAERQKQFADALATREYRVILSGVGGDEVLGGVPTPLPELADYLMSGQIRTLFERSFDFCVSDRTPLLHMLAKITISCFAAYLPLLAKNAQLPPWIPRHLRRKSRAAQIDDRSNVPRFGLSPSKIENGISWWQILETLPHLYPSIAPRYEYRYPYLDRDLVEFLYRIPRDQLVRPGRRRSLMRRALRDIVPAEVLERPRKGALIRGPLLSLQRSETTIRSIFEKSLVGTVGLIDERRLKVALADIAKGTTPRWWPALIKAINLEFWLRSELALRMRIP